MRTWTRHSRLRYNNIRTNYQGYNAFLSELQIVFYEVYPEEIMDEILLCPTEIRTFTISYHYGCDVHWSNLAKDNYILGHVKGLPNLTALRTKLQHDVLDWDLMRELRFFCTKTIAN